MPKVHKRTTRTGTVVELAGGIFRLTGTPKKDRQPIDPQPMLDCASEVVRAYQASDLATLEITEDDPATLQAFDDKGGNMPALKAALLDWAVDYWGGGEATWIQLLDEAKAVHQIADAIATVKRHNQTGEYTALKLAAAKSVIETQLTYSAQHRAVVTSEGGIAIATKTDLLADGPKAALASAILSPQHGGISRCLACDRLFVRPNPRAKFCQLNCRTRYHNAHQRAKRAAS